MPREEKMIAADSIPSQCMNCLVNYYRQGYLPDIVSKVYFCEACRTGLSEKEWQLLERFHSLISLAWGEYDKFQDCSSHDRLYDIDYRLARTHAIRIIYESLHTGSPREEIFNVFNTFKLSAVLRSKLLDLLELLEDYDILIKEKQNGQERKTSTNP